MILTDEKIVVTRDMMRAENLTREHQYGVPVDPNDLAKGVEWKAPYYLSENDFNKIEEYFLIKKKS